MNRSECDNLLRELIRPYAQMKEPEDWPQSSSLNLILDLGLDSFTVVQLLVDIEESFAIELKTEVDMEKMSDYDHLLDFIYEEVKNK